MTIIQKIDKILEDNSNFDFKLVAVSKTKPNELIKEAYEGGQRIFGENKPQELWGKEAELPKDIEWHMIGHLQTNKVKFIAPFVTLIHGVDSLKLLKEINKQAAKIGRVIECLFQIHIGKEDTKFGFTYNETRTLIASEEFASLKNINVIGLMGMATNTEDDDLVREEFKVLKTFFEELKPQQTRNLAMVELSMGMSGDYKIALEEGSTMIRVGSSIFGGRG